MSGKTRAILRSCLSLFLRTSADSKGTYTANIASFKGMPPKPLQGTRKPYPSDLTDAQWELIEPLLPPAKSGGRPRATDMREVINEIFYQARSGCQWNMLPHDFPCKSTVYEYFSQYRDDSTWKRINDVLVGAVRRLHAPSESMTPAAASIDSQTVKSSEHSNSRGYDGGKKITGRKRNIAVDTLGLLLAAVVTIASIDDAYAARQVFEQLKPDRTMRQPDRLAMLEQGAPGSLTAGTDARKPSDAGDALVKRKAK